MGTNGAKLVYAQNSATTQIHRKPFWLISMNKTFFVQLSDVSDRKKNVLST